MSRKIFLALFLTLAGSLFAGEVRTFAPPPETPVIPWTRFNIQYAVRIVGAEGPSKVMFYITTDGGASWKYFGEDKDLRSPMMITVPGEGTYGFTTIISTPLRQGTAPRPGTRPDSFVIVDRTPPTATWITPGAQEIALNANGSITLAWESADAHLGLTPVTLEYSTDGGNFWLPLREKLPAKGSINWTPPLLEGENEIMLRMIASDLAGNKRIVKNRARFLIDRQPPVVSINGPRSAGGYEFDVNYTATDDRSGIGQVELYYTLNDGQEWFFFDSDKDLSKQSMTFHSPSSAQRVGLYLVAADKRGNRTAPPARGARPMLNVELDLQAPQVTILPPFSSTSTVIAKTEPTAIRWSASDVNIRENSAKVEYSVDNGQTWVTLATNQPSNGTYSWTPNLEGDNILLKVSVEDQMNNTGTALSMPFRIDAQRPDTRIDNVIPTNPPSTINNGLDSTQPINNGSSGSNPFDPVIPGSPSGINTPPANSNPPAGNNNTAPTADIEIPGIQDPLGNTPTATTAATETTTPPATTAVAATTTPTTPTISGVPTESSTPVTAEVTTPTTPPATTGSNIDIPGFPSTGGDEPNADNTETTKISPADTTIPSIGNTAPITAPNTGDLGGISMPPSPGADNTTTGTSPVADTKNNTEIQAIGTDDTTIPSISPNTGIPEIPQIPTTGEMGVTSIDKISATETTPATALNPAQLLDQAEQSYANGGNQDEALRIAKEALAKDPNNARGYALLASIYTEKQKFEDAINNAERATRLAPGENRYLQILGYAQYAKANSINRAIASGTVPSAQVHRFTAQVVQSLEDSEKAYQQMLNTANSSETDRKEAYYRLGQIDYFRATRILKDKDIASTSLRKSIANYEKAYAIGAPEYREVLQIGICNYRLTDYDQAERWLVKAQELAPTNRPPKEAFFYLAMIHEKMNRPDNAITFWEKVAQLYPQGSKYQQLAGSRVAALKKQLNP